VIVECQKCGAPLPVVEGQRLTQCTYCGVTSQVRSMRTAAVQTPPGWQPPPQWPPPPQQPYAPPPQWPPPQPAPHLYYQQVARGGSNAVVGVVIGVIGLFMVMGFVSAAVRKGGSVFSSRISPYAAPTVASVPLNGAPVSRTFAGVAGGTIRGSSLSSRCRGYFPSAPQYTLRLTTIQQVRLTTIGSEDLTMAVRDPSGFWRCDDDGGQGSNPLLDVPLPAGTYPVWIGAYHQNARPAFTLDLRAGPLGAVPGSGPLSATAPPTLGVMPLSTYVPIATRSGLAGGPVAASPLGSNCRGYLPEAPHVIVRTTTYLRATLTTAATGDLTMVVQDSRGAVHCDDDSGGASQPRVTAFLPPGDHRVWIGTYGEGPSIPFTLTATAEQGTGLGRSLMPTVAVLDLDSGPRTTTHSGSVVGYLEARRSAPACSGYITAAPQLRITTQRPRRITIAATSGAGVTLLARGPSGDAVCASAGGASSTLDVEIGAGETTVWVGSNTRGRRAAFRVQVTAQPPSGALSVK
jgi:hypothetical protein